MGFSGVLHSEQYPATVDMQCVMIVIPAGDEYLRLLAALLDIAGTPESYDDPDSAQTDGLCFAWDEAYYLTEWIDCGEPPGEEAMNSNIILYPDRASVTSGATPAWTSQTGSSLGGVWQASPSLTGDAIRWDFFLGRGRYNIDLIYQRTTANGKVDLKVYDATLTLITTISLDLRGTAQFNTVGGGSFDLPEGGRIRVEAVGNGTSGATFNRPMQRIIIDKYADL